MIILAYIFPDIAAYMDGRFLEIITSVGVALVFFFYGLKLSFNEIKHGMKNWKLHLSVQLFTFALFPLLVLLLGHSFIPKHKSNFGFPFISWQPCRQQ
jgi:sodium/bile acid cotransporter 7